MSMKLASTSIVRPFTVVEPLSDVAQRYGVRLNVHCSIGGGGVIGAFTGMSAACAVMLAPIATTTALLRNKFFMASQARMAPRSSVAGHLSPNGRFWL